MWGESKHRAAEAESLIADDQKRSGESFMNRTFFFAREAREEKRRHHKGRKARLNLMRKTVGVANFPDTRWAQERKGAKVAFGESVHSRLGIVALLID